MREHPPLIRCSPAPTDHSSCSHLRCRMIIACIHTIRLPFSTLISPTSAENTMDTESHILLAQPCAQDQKARAVLATQSSWCPLVTSNGRSFPVKTDEVSVPRFYTGAKVGLVWMIVFISSLGEVFGARRAPLPSSPPTPPFPPLTPFLPDYPPQPPYPPSPPPDPQLFALLDITTSYSNVSNCKDPFTSWVGTGYCSWSGIKCSGANVTKIDLSTSCLYGSLPSSWSTMAGLQYVSLYSNKLSGSLPSSWSTMAGLLHVDLNFNKLNGSLPSSWSTMAGLLHVDLDSNKLSGSLPSSWSTMAGLQHVYLYSNKLSGSLPSSWSTIIFLLELRLDANLFYGPLPEPWSSLTSLKSINLFQNNLSGTIPSSWSALYSITLGGTINVAANRITGTIPSSLLGFVFPGCLGLQCSPPPFPPAPPLHHNRHCPCR